jgi:type IV secretion system protein TrbF
MKALEEVSLQHGHPNNDPQAGQQSRTDPGVNLYLSARREWDERYGNLITRAKNWRAIAFLCALLALVEASGLIALSMRSKTIPYVVAVDALGRQVAAGTAEENFTPGDRLKRAALLEWMTDLRTVTNDPVAERKAIERVYSRMAYGSAAVKVVDEFYRNDPPQKRMERETVSVDVESVLPTTDKTYEIEWMETVRDLEGEARSKNHWKGAFTIAVHPPTEEQLVRTNPLGIYVTNLSWARVF